MKTKVRKVIFILLILMILFSINTKVYAWSDVVSAGKTFLTERKDFRRNYYTK